jgi:hypothetical protein
MDDLTLYLGSRSSSGTGKEFQLRFYNSVSVKRIRNEKINMKKLVILLAVGTALSLFYTNRTEAGELYRILNSDTLVTARRADLLTFMYLNSHGNKPAVRALYNQLSAQGLLVNFQAGVVVKVTSFYGDGTAQIADDRLIGYIATDDLSQYLGPQRFNWEKVNDKENEL